MACSPNGGPHFFVQVKDPGGRLADYGSIAQTSDGKRFTKPHRLVRCRALGRRRTGGPKIIDDFLLPPSHCRGNYCCAHLMGYAPDIKEGQEVQEGEVIGFVGSTGNASPDAPHLHYQVMRSNANYWNGTPLDVRGFMTKPGRMRN